MASAVNPSFLSDGFSTLERGVNSGRIPSLLSRNQVSFATNTTFRGGYAQQRPGFIKRVLTFGDIYHTESEFIDGRFQGIFPFYPPGANPLLMVSVSGRFHAIDIIKDYNVLDVTPASGPNSSVLPIAYFEQAEDWGILQDGQSGAIIFDGVTSRRAGLNEVPTGTAMAYGMGRLWIAIGKQFIAGDVFGGSSGTATYQKRDAVLKFTENTYLNEGGKFSLPLHSSEITAMRFTAQINTALGQGELLVGTARAVFSVHVPVDRTQWKNLTTPIQRIALLEYGPTSQNSMAIVNSDFFFRAQNGVQSLVLAQRQFSGYGNAPLSREVSRVLRADEKRLLKYSSAVLFDERLLMTCAPHQVSGKGVYHRGLVSLDFDPLSSMDDKTPPEWDGVWSGLNILQVVTITVRDEERCFAMVLSPCDTLELWEITKEDRFDNGSNRVVWTIELPSYTWENAFQLKRLQAGDMWIDRVTGLVNFNVDFRSDQYPGWIDWHDWSECANYQDCDYGTYGVCRTIPTFSEQYRPRMRLPQPPDLCDETFPKYHRDGYEFQPKLTVTGFARIRQMRLHASLQPEIQVACQPAGTCKTLSVCDTDPFTYVSDTDIVCPVVPAPPPPEPGPPDCPECPPAGDCSGWEDDPFVGSTLAGRFRRDGVSSNYLAMANDTTLGRQFIPANTSFTCGAWVKFNDLMIGPAAFSDIMSRWTGGGNEQFALSYCGGAADSLTQFMFQVHTGSTAPYIVSAQPPAVLVGVWYLVVGAYDHVNGQLRIWVNGSQTSIGHSGLRGGPIEGLVVGNRGGAGSSFDGLIESLFVDVGLVWSHAAVNVLYNAGIGVRYSRLIHKGLPVPRLWLEFEDSTLVGKNSNGGDGNLVNFQNSGGTTGLVTLEPGLPLS